MSLNIKIKRATREQLDTAAAANGLLQGEPYLITDEDRIAVGLSVSTYEVYAKDVHSHSDLHTRKHSVTSGDDHEMATARIIGRTTASTGAPEELTAAQVREFLGVAVQAAQFGTTITDDANITAALHKFKYTDVNKATDVTLTLKKNEYLKGEWFVLIQTGAGQFELDCDAEVTVPDWNKSAGSGHMMYVYCVDDTEDDNVFRIEGGVE